MGKALRIAVCEDNSQDRKAILEAIEASGYPADTAAFPTGQVFLETFAKDRYDIILMDIYMPGKTGLEIARSIRQADERAVLVFTTSSPDHTLEGYRLGALMYMEKPIAPEAVKAALELAWRLRKGRETIPVAAAGGKREIPLEDIRYVEARNHTCVLHLGGEQVETRLGIEDIAGLLPPPGFQRCHRSYIVNLAHVRAVDRDFVMAGGERVYIRGKDVKRMEELFARYLAAEVRRDWDEGTADSSLRDLSQ